MIFCDMYLNRSMCRLVAPKFSRLERVERHFEEGLAAIPHAATSAIAPIVVLLVEPSIGNPR